MCTVVWPHNKAANPDREVATRERENLVTSATNTGSSCTPLPRVCTKMAFPMGPNTMFGPILVLYKFPIYHCTSSARILDGYVQTQAKYYCTSYNRI